MIFLWLALWVLSGTPSVTINPFNTWAIALAVCIAIEVLD